MATINDLKNIPTIANIADWVRSFSEQEQEILKAAFLAGKPKDVYDIVVALDENPFPFTRGALSSHMKELREKN